MFMRHLPCTGNPGRRVRLTVQELHRWDWGIIQAWHSMVQPDIDKSGPRADQGWDWRKIALLLWGAGMRRGPRLFQLQVGPELRPVAMLALLENERWVNDPQRPAVYVWYLSTAPRSISSATGVDGSPCTPGLVGKAALDVALCVSQASDGGGRLWLHADPNGGDSLIQWYGLDAHATRIPDIGLPFLPGDGIRGARPNDHRYFAFTDETALWATQQHTHFR